MILIDGKKRMLWGNFIQPFAVHSAPITEQATVLPGHILSPDCECRPTPEFEPGYRKILWLHHDNH